MVTVIGIIPYLCDNDSRGILRRRRGNAVDKGHVPDHLGHVTLGHRVIIVDGNRAVRFNSLNCKGFCRFVKGHIPVSGHLKADRALAGFLHSGLRRHHAVIDDNVHHDLLRNGGDRQLIVDLLTGRITFGLLINRDLVHSVRSKELELRDRNVGGIRRDFNRLRLGIALPEDIAIRDRAPDLLFTVVHDNAGIRLVHIAIYRIIRRRDVVQAQTVSRQRSSDKRIGLIRIANDLAGSVQILSAGVDTVILDLHGAGAAGENRIADVFLGNRGSLLINRADIIQTDVVVRFAGLGVDGIGISHLDVDLIGFLRAVDGADVHRDDFSVHRDAFGVRKSKGRQLLSAQRVKILGNRIGKDCFRTGRRNVFRNRIQHGIQFIRAVDADALACIGGNRQQILVLNILCYLNADRISGRLVFILNGIGHIRIIRTIGRSVRNEDDKCLAVAFIISTRASIRQDIMSRSKARKIVCI